MKLNALFTEDIEFVANTSNNSIVVICNGLTSELNEFLTLRQDVYNILKKHLYSSYKRVLFLKKYFGCNTEAEMISKMIFCMLGGLGTNNDIDLKNSKINAEEWDCGNINTCPAYNIVCERKLTRTEFCIAKEIATGKTDKDIALSMHKSVNTVRNQHSSILYKLCISINNHFNVVAINTGIL